MKSSAVLLKRVCCKTTYQKQSLECFENSKGATQHSPDATEKARGKEVATESFDWLNQRL